MSVFDAACINEIATRTQIPELEEEVAKAVARELEYRIREITQQGLKFMKHSKRSKLQTTDINNALRFQNIGNGFYGGKDHPAQFKTVPGSSKLYFVEDKILECDDLIQFDLPPAPKDVEMALHWLAINGIQPNIPENSLAEKGEQRWKGEGGSGLAFVGANNVKTDSVNELQNIKHVLGKELQIYFERVSSTMRTGDESAITISLDHVMTDTGINQLVPYFTQFITEEVSNNLRNISILKALMKLARSLLDNTSLNLEPYLHQIMPAILTCIVGRRLCNNPLENHWELREYAADLVAYICHRYSDSYKSLQPRVSKTLGQAFLDPSKPLTTHYGAIVGVTKLGKQAIQSLIIPHIQDYMKLLRPELSSGNGIRALEAGKCYESLLSAVKIYVNSWLESSLGSETNEILQQLLEAFGDDLGRMFPQLDKLNTNT